MLDGSRSMDGNRNGLTGSKRSRYEESVNNPLFDNPLWDIRKTSEMLAVSQGTLRDWIYKRRIPFKKVGNLVRFDPSAILHWIEERSNHGH